MHRGAFLAGAGALALGGARGRASSSAWLPMEVRANRPPVNLVLRGPGGAARGVLGYIDTGGGDLVVTRAVARALGAAPVGLPVGSGDGSTQALAPLRLEVGSTEIYVPSGSAAMLVADVPVVEPGLSVQAAFPARLLRGHRIVFDYSAHRFGIDEAAPGGVDVPVRIDARYGFPRVEIAIGDERYGMLVDTGASCTMLSQAAIDRLKATHSQWRSVEGAYDSANMIGGALEAHAEMLRVGEMSIGGIALQDVVAVSRPIGTFERWMSQMTAAPVAGSLGGNVLRNFSMVLDYRTGALTLALHNDPVAHQFEIVPVTLTPGFDGGYTIAAALPGAAFSMPRAALAGARLLAVDGTGVDGASLARVHELLRGVPGTHKRLQITEARGGVRRDILAPVVRLF